MPDAAGGDGAAVDDASSSCSLRAFATLADATAIDARWTRGPGNAEAFSAKAIDLATMSAAQQRDAHPARAALFVISDQLKRRL